MLWVLLPLVGVMTLAGSTVLMIYGKAFEQGGAWLAIVAAGCATNAFVGLGETVIMVQRPKINLINSSIACLIAIAANLWLIPRYGITGAAIGILVPYIIQGILRTIVLRFVFKWHNDWRTIVPPVVTSSLAIVPALISLSFIPGIAGQFSAALIFLAGCGIGWIYYSRSGRIA
jgi:O-antigen/teichoic acid export membrane protein